jgi:hypothetical protein
VDPGFSLLIPVVSIGRDRRLLLRLVDGVLDVYCSSHRIATIHLLPRPYGTGASWLAGRGSGLAHVAYIDARAYATGSATEVAADRARLVGEGTGWHFLLLVKRAAACGAVCSLSCELALLGLDWLRKK